MAKLTTFEHFMYLAGSAKTFVGNLMSQFMEATISTFKELNEKLESAEKQAADMQKQIKKNNSALSGVVDSGKKNFIDTSRLKSEHRTAEIICRNNGDGSLTISGKRASTEPTVLISNINAGIYSTADQIQGQFLSEAGDYVIAAQGYSNGLKLQIYGTDTEDVSAMVSLGQQTGEVTYFTIDKVYKYIHFRLSIAGGADFGEGITTFPMICKKELYDISPGFVPYVPSLAELASRLAALEASPVSTLLPEDERPKIFESEEVPL